MKCYDVHGLHLRIVVGSAELDRCAGSILRPFEAPEHDADGYRVTIDYGSVPSHEEPPPHMRRLGGADVGGLRAVSWTGQNRLRRDILGMARLCVDLTGREVQITVRPGAESCVGRLCIVPMLCVLLARRGHYLIHGASVAVESRGRWLGIVFAGPSGSGKSTTSLALYKAGFMMQADDASFLTQRQGGPPGAISLWGLPLNCKVHKNTLAMMPWLKRLPSSPAATKDEFLLELPVEDCADGRFTAEPRLVLFLDGCNRNEHRIRPLDKIEAMAELTRQNVRAGGDNIEGAAEAFRLFGRLIKHADSYSLSVGPQLETLGGEIRSLLG